MALRTSITRKAPGRTIGKLVAISYARVSTDEQSDEDRSGFERQEKAIASWLAAHPEYELDREIQTVGSGAKEGRFEWFIEELEEGRLPPGTCLVVEKISRFSREPVTQVFETLIRLFKAGGCIAACELNGNVLSDLDGHNGEVFMLLGGISTARKEWEERRDRNLGSIASKRRKISEGEKPFKERRPGKRSAYQFWLDFDAKADCFTLNAHAEWVKKAFLMAPEVGSTRIASHLNDEGFTTSKGKKIHGSWISKLLTNRAVLGEWQPVDAKGNPVGDPVPGVYPPLLTEEEWRAARQGVERRNRGGVSTGSQRHNLFEGRIFCGCCGGRLGFSQRPHRLADGTEKFFSYLRCLTAERDSKVCGARKRPYDEDRLLSRIQNFRWADYFNDESHQSELAEARRLLLSRQEDRASAERVVQNLQEGLRQLLREGAVRTVALAEQELQKALQQQEEAQSAENEAAATLENLGRRRTGKDAQRAIQDRVENFLASERTQRDARFEFNDWLRQQSLVIVFDLDRDQIEVGTGDPGTDGRLVELDQRVDDLAVLGASREQIESFRKQLQRERR